MKPHAEVKAPVPYDQNNNRTGIPGTPSMTAKRGFLLKDVFDTLIRHQDRDIDAEGLIVIDETGIDSTPAKPEDYDKLVVCCEIPNFDGAEGRAIAKKWFAEEFGITFSEEEREMTVYAVTKE